MKLIKIRNKGFSLLEILLVLAVAAALVIGAFMLYPKLVASQKIEKESKNITTLQAGVKALYAGRSRLSGLSPTVLIQSKNVPDNMVQDGKLINEWKGEVDIAYQGNHGKYSITYNGVPAEACSKFITGVSGNFVSITIYNGGSGGDVKNDEEGKPLEVAKTASACGSDTVSTIMFSSII